MEKTEYTNDFFCHKVSKYVYVSVRILEGQNHFGNTECHNNKVEIFKNANLLHRIDIVYYQLWLTICPYYDDF